MTKSFEIFFDDLTEETQMGLLEFLDVDSKSDMNYEIIPVATVEIECDDPPDENQLEIELKLDNHQN